MTHNTRYDVPETRTTQINFGALSYCLKMTFLKSVWDTLAGPQMSVLEHCVVEVLRRHSTAPQQDLADMITRLNVSDVLSELAGHITVTIGHDPKEFLPVVHVKCDEPLGAKTPKFNAGQKSQDRFMKLWEQSNEIGLTHSGMSADMVQAIFENILFGKEVE